MRRYLHISVLDTSHNGNDQFHRDKLRRFSGTGHWLWQFSFTIGEKFWIEPASETRPLVAEINDVDRFRSSATNTPHSPSNHLHKERITSRGTGEEHRF